MNNGKVIDTFLTHNESFKNIDDFSLLLICGLFFDIHNNLLNDDEYSDIKNINFVKRIISIHNQIKKIKSDVPFENVDMKNILNSIKIGEENKKNKTIIKEGKEIKENVKVIENKKSNSITKSAVLSNPNELSSDQDILKSSEINFEIKNNNIDKVKTSLLKSKIDHQLSNNDQINLEKISYANITKGIKANDNIETNNVKEEKLVDENVRPDSGEKIKKNKQKIDYSNKEEYCKIVNDYKNYIVKIGNDAIEKTGIDRYGNKLRYREITDEIKNYGNILHKKYEETFSNQHVAFSYIHYGPLKIKKDNNDQNYNERNLSIYEKYEMNLAFIDAQNYFLEKGYKLLDITDPDYYTRDFIVKKSNYANSNFKSTKIIIILVDLDYIIKHENVNLWHGFNKINKIKKINNKIEAKTKNDVIPSAIDAFNEVNNSHNQSNNKNTDSNDTDADIEVEKINNYSENNDFNLIED